jgi:hypothetical protein
MQLHDPGPLAPCPQALGSARFALLPMDRPRLFAFLVHRERNAAVQQLLVHLVCCGREEEHHRAFDHVLVRHVLAAHRVFAGRGDIQLAFRLQQLQRIAGAFRALLLRDGQDLVLEIFLPHVKQRLPGHRRVAFPLFFRHEVEHRFHQRTFARRG